MQRISVLIGSLALLVIISPELLAQEQEPDRALNAAQQSAVADVEARSDELADILEVNKNTVRATLSRAKGRFVTLPDGRWGNTELINNPVNIE